MKLSWTPPKGLKIEKIGSSIHWTYPSSELIDGFELQMCPASEDQEMSNKWQSVCFIFAQNIGADDIKYSVSLPLKGFPRSLFRLKVLHVNGLYAYFYVGIGN